MTHSNRFMIGLLRTLAATAALFAVVLAVVSPDIALMTADAALAIGFYNMAELLELRSQVERLRDAPKARIER